METKELIEKYEKNLKRKKANGNWAVFPKRKKIWKTSARQGLKFAAIPELPLTDV